MFLKRKATWHLLLKKKMLTAALAILTVNLFVALFAAYLTPYDPVRDLQVADDFALPEWATTLMGLRDLPKIFLERWKCRIGPTKWLMIAHEALK